MNTKIRIASIEDIPILTQLLMTVHQLHVDAMPERYKPLSADNPALHAHYRTRLKRPQMSFFIAEVDGEPAGFVSCELQQSPGNLFAYGIRRVHIDQITVLESHQGQGVGTALMNRAIEFAHEHNAKQITLGVAGFNTQAINFYKQIGFTTMSHRMAFEVKPS